jgi:hypothetical protein
MVWGSLGHWAFCHAVAARRRRIVKKFAPSAYQGHPETVLITPSKPMLARPELLEIPHPGRMIGAAPFYLECLMRASDGHGLLVRCLAGSRQALAECFGAFFKQPSWPVSSAPLSDILLGDNKTPPAKGAGDGQS